MRTAAPLLALLLAPSLGSARVLAQSASPETTAVGALAALERAAAAPVRITLSPATQLATFVAAEPGAGVPLPGSAAAAEARVRSFVAQYGAAFGLADAAQVRTLRVSGPDETGMEHVRLQQAPGGVPVAGGELSVHLRGGEVVAVLARTVPDADRVPTAPGIDAARAEAVARALLAQLDASDAVLGAPRLELFNRGLFDGGRAPTRLAWFLEGESISRQERIWVDAQTGAVLLHFNQRPTLLNRQVYDAANAAQYGPLVRAEGDPPSGIPQADDTYDFAGDTYNYYFGEHGRDSYDNAGGALVNVVRSCPTGLCSGLCPCPNAFNATYISFFGDGWATDDIVAHEWTHGVTAFAAGLVYMNQSGALNESYSDVFGESIDLTNGAGTDTPAVRWLVAEDLNGSGIRNMMNPPSFGDPGKMSDAVYCGEFDNGGVHTNSGIPNHAYALMADGGTYNGFTITGIGLTKAGKIAYRALNDYLVATATMLDNYNALNQSCADLIGTAGITAADCDEVLKALDAVEMDAPWACTPIAACGTQPRTNCRTAAKSLLVLKQAGGSRDKLRWKWSRGEPTTISDFGNPFAGNNYTLCVYAGSAGSAIEAIRIPGIAARWDSIDAIGFEYRDVTGASDGIQKAILKGSTENKSLLLVKGKGDGLPDPVLGSLPAPITVQLVHTDNTFCWEAVYPGTAIVRNDPDQLKAKFAP